MAKQVLLYSHIRVFLGINKPVTDIETEFTLRGSSLSASMFKGEIKQRIIFLSGLLGYTRFCSAGKEWSIPLILQVTMKGEKRNLPMWLFTKENKLYLVNGTAPDAVTHMTPAPYVARWTLRLFEQFRGTVTNNREWETLEEDERINAGRSFLRSFAKSIRRHLGEDALGENSGDGQPNRIHFKDGSQIVLCPKNGLREIAPEKEQTP